MSKQNHTYSSDRCAPSIMSVTEHLQSSLFAVFLGGRINISKFFLFSHFSVCMLSARIPSIGCKLDSNICRACWDPHIWKAVYPSVSVSILLIRCYRLSISVPPRIMKYTHRYVYFCLLSNLQEPSTFFFWWYYYGETNVSSASLQCPDMYYKECAVKAWSFSFNLEYLSFYWLPILTPIC